MENKLFDLFNVSSHTELMAYIQNHPNEKKVEELKEFMAYSDVNMGDNDD